MTIATQLQLFQVDAIPSKNIDMDDCYSCQAHGDFELSHFYPENLLQKLIQANGHVPCPFCLIEKENQEEFRRINNELPK